MPNSSRACPTGAPAVTSLRPSRLATRMAPLAESAGTVMPAGGVTSLLADAALIANVADATAATTAPTPQARRRFPLLFMVVPSLIYGRRLVRGPHPVVRR